MLLAVFLAFNCALWLLVAESAGIADIDGLHADVFYPHHADKTATNRLK